MTRGKKYEAVHIMVSTIANYTHGFPIMGTKNISISDEAYSRLAALKGVNESFTDVINRLTGKRSILDLAGVLSDREANEMRTLIRKARESGRKRLSNLIEEMR